MRKEYGGRAGMSILEGLREEEGVVEGREAMAMASTVTPDLGSLLTTRSPHTGWQW